MAMAGIDKLDLSTLKKDHTSLINLFQVQEHMKKFLDVTRIEKVVSCYRSTTTAKRIYRTYMYPEYIIRDYINMSSLGGYIHSLFFPVWILLALIPEEEGKCLTIGEIVVGKIKDIIVKHDDSGFPQWFSDDMAASGLKIGKGCLKVEHFTVVCKSGGSFRLDNLRVKLSQYGAIECVKCTLKVFIDQSEDYSSQLRRLQEYVGENDELKLVFDVEDGKDVTSILPYREDLIDIPLCSEGHCESNHTMFMLLSYFGSVQKSGRYIFSLEDKSVAADFIGNGILIATLGYGCDKDKTIFVLGEKNFANETAPVYSNCVSSPWIISKYTKTSPFIDYTKTSPFIVCQTTYGDGTIANGATVKAIKWLREEWKEKWQKEYDNLVILIPYGGQYMEDEMREIYGATDEGIIIVCAAGGDGGGVVFPAALGTVISVGVAGSGPRGREVDICVDHSDTGIAAAEITGLLSLLLARLHSVVKNPPDSLKEIAESIKKVPHYLHTCVIRELLVNEGTGSHDPQRGYGNGEEIFNKLKECSEDLLLRKMADILLKNHAGSVYKDTCMVDSKAGITPITDEARKVYFHDLDGSGTSVAVIDMDFSKGVESGNARLGFSMLPVSHVYAIIVAVLVLVLFQCVLGTTSAWVIVVIPVLVSVVMLYVHIMSTEVKPPFPRHGDICLDIIKCFAPNATAIPIRGGISSATECSEDVSIISCSMGTDQFDLAASRAVSKAVMAGKIPVFAAGNEGERFRNAIAYPARIGNVLVIGGQDTYNSHLSFSSVGRELDFLAPAVLGSHRGTSYAAPVIAGYIALLLQFIKEMPEDDYRITAWHENPAGTGKYEWGKISIWKAAHNVYAMRDLLKMFIARPQEHSQKSGFGCIYFSVVFPSYRNVPKDFIVQLARKQIHERLQKFYCKQIENIVIN